MKNKKVIWKIMQQEVLEIIIILAPIFIPYNIIDFINKIISIFWKISIGNDINGWIVKVITSIAIYFIIYTRINKEKEFLNGNIYGDVDMFFYHLANILGYKISLVRKPYDIQFRLLIKDSFKIIHEEIIKDEEVNVSVDASNFNYSNNLRECNLVISDTYPININQLPNSKINLDTIIIKREKSQKDIRVYSPKLVQAVSDSVEMIQKSGARINLYLTTNTKNTEKIVKSVFMKANRSKYDVYLFLQSAEENRRFKEKGIRFKFG